MSFWKPIATAPKDGTLVFIKEKGGRVQVAKWCCANGYDLDWYVQLTNPNGLNDSFPTTEVVYWMDIPK